MGLVWRGWPEGGMLSVSRGPGMRSKSVLERASWVRRRPGGQGRVEHDVTRLMTCINWGWVWGEFYVDVFGYCSVYGKLVRCFLIL